MQAVLKRWLEGVWRELAPPWRRYEITSQLAPAEIVEVMQGVTGPRRWFRPQPSREFSGTITTSGFVVSRTISIRNPSYRNSFLPVIVGRLEWMPGGTRIRITMRLTWHMLAFWTCWMTGVIVGVLTFLIQVPEVRGDLGPMFILVVARFWLCDSHDVV